MASEKEQFLNTAQETTRVINHLIATDQVLIPRKNPQAAIGRFLLNCWVRDITLVGNENIEEAKEHLQQKLTITPNHKSDGDHRGIVHGLGEAGYEDFAQSIGFIGGLNMYRRAATRVFLGADPLIFIETPAEIAAREKWEAELKDNEIYKARVEAAKSFVIKSGREIVKWQRAGKPLLVYPGATRQRTNEVISPPEKVSAYVKKGMWFLPVYSTGMEKILPPLQMPNVFARTSLHIRAGRCYQGDEVIELLKDPQVVDAGINAADIMMARIALLNPDTEFSPEFFDKYRVLKKNDPYMHLNKQ